MIQDLFDYETRHLGDRPDLHALVIRLVAAKTGQIRATQGHLAYAAFLRIVDQVDPDLSQWLHDRNQRKPFTISPLEGFEHPHNGFISVQAGQEGWLRVTLLEHTLFQTFIRYFWEGKQTPTIYLNEIPFHIVELVNNPQSNPLAGSLQLAQLYEKWRGVAKIQEYDRLPLSFRTPTAFSIRDAAVPYRKMCVLPEPARVLGELARYWDHFTGGTTQAAVQQYAEQHVIVIQHKIETRMYMYKQNRKQIGFWGTVTYQILDKEQLFFIEHCNRLADLAFYTGVGGKTTMGMGQVNRALT